MINAWPSVAGNGARHRRRTVYTHQFSPPAGDHKALLFRLFGLSYGWGCFLGVHDHGSL